jgi:hypothetical protein
MARHKWCAAGKRAHGWDRSQTVHAGAELSAQVQVGREWVFHACAHLEEDVEPVVGGLFRGDLHALQQDVHQRVDPTLRDGGGDERQLVAS